MLPQVFAATLTLHGALPISAAERAVIELVLDDHPSGRVVLRDLREKTLQVDARRSRRTTRPDGRAEEHRSELQSPRTLVCRLLLEKKRDHAERCRRGPARTR